MLTKFQTSFQKYLQTISNVDPGKIYVENVRSILRVPKVVAKMICEMAVIDRQFVKKIGILCPNEGCNCRIICSYNKISDIPAEIECEICEIEERQFKFNTRNLEKIYFYKLAVQQ